MAIAHETPLKISTRPNGPVAISATNAKNEFSHPLDTVIQGGKVAITRHDSPKAVLISIDQFNTLTNSHRTELDALTDEFDQMLAGMQTADSRERMQSAFDATPKELGKAARATARKRARKRV